MAAIADRSGWMSACCCVGFVVFGVAVVLGRHRSLGLGQWAFLPT